MRGILLKEYMNAILTKARGYKAFVDICMYTKKKL